ncbi:unnamed protein product [Owenia fusiformis]|uniref:Enoyl reductase (ER) domain-containing protein n=1 Tax=Owenia fusiformis TaxID=6347 RepID=A0A8S4NYA7_OWEFU|nr:unnamed protein product [Owenia fusiformis]
MNDNDNLNMKRAHRTSVTEPYQLCSNNPVPEIPRGGCRIRVVYAGACFTDSQLRKTGRRPKMAGFEVSGVIDQVCNSVPNCNLLPGDKVVVYPDGEEKHEVGYSEYIAVKDLKNVFKLPESMSLEIGSMLPSSALTAYSAVKRAEPHVRDLMKTKESCNILIVGAGGLGLWTLTLAKHFIGQNSDKVRITVADTSIEKLIVAQDHGCYDVIHWSDCDHEQYLVERTLDVCRGGVDVVIDFVSSQRTMNRAIRCLNREGMILAGGNSRHEVMICLNDLAANAQSILGVSKGSRAQLEELLNVFAAEQVQPPCYSVFPVEQVNSVFEKLSSCQIDGRAILKVSEVPCNN